MNIELTTDRTFMGRAQHVFLLNQKKTCILVIVNEPILSSMLAAGIVQDMFAREAGEGERGRRSGDDWRLLLPPGQEILPISSHFVAIEFLSQITNTRIRIRNAHTYTYIYIKI